MSSNYEFIQEADKSVYDSFSDQMLQSYEWANMKPNWEHHHTALLKDGQPAVVGLVLAKVLPLGFKMYYLPHGPVGDWSSPDMKEYFARLKEMAKKDRALMIKFDPNIARRTWLFKDGMPETADDSVIEFVTKQLGGKHSGLTTVMHDTIQPRFTMGVDLDGDFRKGYARNTRRALKSAAQYGVKIDTYTKDSPDLEQALDAFMNVIHSTEDTKNISLRNRDYFKRLMTSFDGAVLYLGSADLKQIADEMQAKLDAGAFKNDKEKEKLEKDLSKVEEMRSYGTDHPIITGLLEVDYAKTAELMYMGNDRRYTMLGATQKAYDFSYEAAQKKGYLYADMSGVEGTLDDGLTKAKAAYGARVRELVGEFDLPVNKLLYPAASKAYQYLKSRFS